MTHDDIPKWIATSLLIIGTIFLNLGDINIGRILLFVGGVIMRHKRFCLEVSREVMYNRSHDETKLVPDSERST